MLSNITVFSGNRGHSEASISKQRAVLGDGHHRGRGEVEEADDRQRARICLGINPRNCHGPKLEIGNFKLLPTLSDSTHQTSKPSREGNCRCNQ